MYTKEHKSFHSSAKYEATKDQKIAGWLQTLPTLSFIGKSATSY
jgi:hypothetical protein